MGATRASGITKLMMSEAQNFPDIAAFYQHEVIEPGQALIRQILQRGMARGSFAPSTWDYAVYSLIAPMIFLVLSRHPAGVCFPEHRALDPEKYIASPLSIVLPGLSLTPQAGSAAPKAAS